MGVMDEEKKVLEEEIKEYRGMVKICKEKLAEYKLKLKLFEKLYKERHSP